MHTLDDLKQKSIHIVPGTVVFWPRDNSEYLIYPEETVSKFNGRFYAANNSTIAFVSDGELFVTPYTRAATDILRDTDYKEAGFYVPFSNGDYPKYAAGKWRSLREWARRTYLEDYTNDCNEWSDQHGFGALSDEILARTICVPETGIPFHSPRDYNDIYHSECSIVLDAVAITRIGTYSCNNGVVLFIYRDGSTRLTRGYKIITDLRAAGYKEEHFFVPFSNGETITDPEMAARWESLKRK